MSPHSARVLDFVFHVTNADGAKLDLILNRLNLMPDNEQLKTEIEGLKADLTSALDTEIAEITAKLEEGGVSEGNLQLLRDFRTAFATRISGIVPNTPPPEV